MAEVTATPDAAIQAPDIQTPAAPDMTSSLPAAVPPPATGPATPPPMSFREGIARGVGKSYVADNQGNIIDAAPARTPSVRGSLAGILMGALEGATRAVAAPTPEGAKGLAGAAVSGATSAERGAIEADKRARAIAQTNFQNQQAATEARVKQSLWNAQQADLMLKMDHEKALFPEQMKRAGLENEELGKKNDLYDLQIKAAKNEQASLADNFLATMSSQGFDVTKITHGNTTGTDKNTNIFQSLHPSAPMLASGKAVLLHSGGTDADNGAVVTTPQDLKNFKLTEDYHYPIYTGLLDPKTGVPQQAQVGGTVAAKDASGKPTGATAYDAYIAMQGAQMQLDRQSKMLAAGLQQEHVKAQIGQEKSATFKNVQEGEKAKVETEQIKQFLPETGTPGATATGTDYLSSLPEGLRNTLQAVAEGRETRSPRQFLDKNGNPTPFTQALNRAYPDFDVAKATQYSKLVHDFNTGKEGQQIQAGATAVDHLKELQQLNTIKSRIIGTEDYNKYQNKLDTLAGELINFYGMAHTNDSVNSLKHTLGATFNRDSAIREQAKSMRDKFGEFKQQWKNGQVRPSYTPPMPLVSPQAESSLASLANEGTQGGQGDFFKQYGGQR